MKHLKLFEQFVNSQKVLKLESVNEGINFKKAKQALIDFNNGKLSEDDMVKSVIKSLGFKFDKFSEEEAGNELGSKIRKGKIPTDDYILNNVIDVLSESVNEAKYNKDLDKIEAAVKNAKSFMAVGAELRKAGIKYEYKIDYTTSMIPMYMIKVKGNTIGIASKKYVAGAEREVGDIAIGLLEGLVNESTGMGKSVNESLRDASEHLDAVTKALPELEKLIFKYNKLKVKLKAEKADTRSGINIRIFSDDLSKDLSPLGKTVFKTIQISFWGGSETSDGTIWFNPKVSYTHLSGGSNGTDFIWDSLWFDPITNKWIEGRRF